MAIGVKVRKGSATNARRRRHFRLRKKIAGSATRPRLVVSRSTRHLFVQVINDELGQTIVSASTMEADLRNSTDDKTAKSRTVGELIAKRAVAAGISTLSKPTPALAITFNPFAAAIASASILVAERIKTASTPLESAASNSLRSAPLQLRTSNSGPNAANVAGLSSSAINTTGLATRCGSLFVIIFV